MTRTIGIDLGTTSSALAILDGDRPVILAATMGDHMTSHSVTAPAYRRQPLPDGANSSGAFFPVLQFLGRSFDDATVQLASKDMAIGLHRGADGTVMVTPPNRGRAITVDELVTKMLRRLRKRAESYVGAHLDQAVVAIPAHFDSDQRKAVRRAAAKAGLTVLRLIDAPTAASLAFGQQRGSGGRKWVLAIDMDKGHVDVSLIKLEDAMATSVANDGDGALGHAAWAMCIADYLAQGFLRRHGTDLRNDTQARLRLQMAAEMASTQLLETDEVVVDLPFVASGVHGPHHLKMTLPRHVYDAQTATLKARLEEVIASVFRQANLQPQSIDDVLLVGEGAAQATLREVAGAITSGASLVIDDRRELAAIGAALQARRAVTEDHVSGQSATRLSLGLETVGGLMTTIIPRNTPLPARRVNIFSTSEDNQTDIEITILQGERPLALDNQRLGVVRVQGIPEAPRGTPQIEVTFEVSEEGILQVTARDLATDFRNGLTVDVEKVICEGDAQRLLEEARAHEADDLRKRARVETQNLGRQTIYQTKRYLQHLNGVGGRQGCKRARRKVEGKLRALQEAIAVQDEEKIQNLTDELQAASDVLNKLAYGRAEAPGSRPDPDTVTRGNGANELQISIEEL